MWVYSSPLWPQKNWFDCNRILRIHSCFLGERSCCFWWFPDKPCTYQCTYTSIQHVHMDLQQCSAFSPTALLSCFLVSFKCVLFQFIMLLRNKWDLGCFVGADFPTSALSLCIMKTLQTFTLIQASITSHQNTLCSRTHQSAITPSQRSRTWRTNCMVYDYLSFSFGAATSSHFHTVGDTSHLLSLNRLCVLKSSHWVKNAEESTADTWMNCDVLVERWATWQMSQSPKNMVWGITWSADISAYSSWRKEIYICTPSNSSLQRGTPFADDCCSDTLFAPPISWICCQFLIFVAHLLHQIPCGGCFKCIYFGDDLH